MLHSDLLSKPKNTCELGEINLFQISYRCTKYVTCSNNGYGLFAIICSIFSTRVVGYTENDFVIYAIKLKKSFKTQFFIQLVFTVFSSINLFTC